MQEVAHVPVEDGRPLEVGGMPELGEFNEAGTWDLVCKGTQGWGRDNDVFLG
jgi:hypothetical protein